MDDFALLGCSPNASKEEINAAWRALARTNHPDGAKDPAAAGERMKAINAARQRIMAGTPIVDKTARKGPTTASPRADAGAKSAAGGMSAAERAREAMRTARAAAQAAERARAQERANAQAAWEKAARESGSRKDQKRADDMARRMEREQQARDARQRREAEKAQKRAWQEQSRREKEQQARDARARREAEKAQERAWQEQSRREKEQQARDARQRREAEKAQERAWQEQRRREKEEQARAAREARAAPWSASAAAHGSVCEIHATPGQADALKARAAEVAHKGGPGADNVVVASRVTVSGRSVKLHVDQPPKDGVGRIVCPDLDLSNPRFARAGQQPAVLAVSQVRDGQRRIEPVAGSGVVGMRFEIASTEPSEKWRATGALRRAAQAAYKQARSAGKRTAGLDITL